MKASTAALTSRFKQGFARYENFIRKFVYTDYYLLLVTAVTVIGWVTKCAPFGIATLSLIACLVLLGSDDILPLTINIFGAVLVIYTDNVGEMIYMWPALLPMAPCMIIFLIRNFRHKFKLGKMFFPQVAVTVALLMGGIGTVAAKDYMRALPMALVLGLGVLAVYVLYNHFLKRDGEHDIRLYFAKVMVYLGIVISLELVTTIARSDIPFESWSIVSWNLGWGNRNNVATYLILTAGLSLYLSSQYRCGWAYFAIGVVQYVCIVLTFSRGGIIFGGISGIIAVVLTMFYSKNKREHFISVAVILAVALALSLIFMKEINDVISALVARGFGTSGRTDLYKEAVLRFKEHPIFGVGMGYVGNNFDINTMGTYWFHSTVYQVLASMGIMGVLAYGYYYSMRFYIALKDIKNPFNLFILAVWVGFEGYCLIDAGTFVPYPNMMLIIVMALLTENCLCEKNNVKLNLLKEF